MKDPQKLFRRLVAERDRWPRSVARIEVYKDVACEWRWRMLSPNGRIIADGAEGYTRKNGAATAANRVIEFMRYPLATSGWELSPFNAGNIPQRAALKAAWGKDA